MYLYNLRVHTFMLKDRPQRVFFAACPFLLEIERELVTPSAKPLRLYFSGV